jgi:carbamoyl-phosphate synthase large subunit
MGFKILATKGTSEFFSANGLSNRQVFKVSEGRPNVVDMMKNNEISLVFNTPSGKRTLSDSYWLRRTALDYEIPYVTTMAGARATVKAIEALKTGKKQVKPLQEYYPSR